MWDLYIQKIKEYYQFIEEREEQELTQSLTDIDYLGQALKDRFEQVSSTIKADKNIQELSKFPDNIQL